MPKKLTLEIFIKKAFEIHGDKYDYSLVDYVNNYTKIIIICSVHGEFEQFPSAHLQGKGCMKCRNKNLTLIQTFTLEEFIEKTIKTHGCRYDYSRVVYEGYNVKISIVCPKHGEFKQAPYKHLEGRGCPNCSSSKGEKIIQDILDKNKIEYLKEYRLPLYKFRYDFYLPDHSVLIEFHGGQHYKPIDFFGGEERFKEDKKRDLFKKVLAKQYKLPILYFNYKHLRLPKQEFEKLLLKSIGEFV